MPTIDSLLGRNIIGFNPEEEFDTSNQSIYRLGFLDYDDYEND